MAYLTLERVSDFGRAALGAERSVANNLARPSSVDKSSGIADGLG